MFNRYDESVNIQFEIDGRVLRGTYRVQYYPNYRILNVYYKGKSASETLVDDAAISQVATRLFEQLVVTHYVKYEQIHSALPNSIRKAAFLFVNDLKDESTKNQDRKPWQTLVYSFGEQSVGTIEHKRVSWLCLNVLKCVIPAWKAECDDDVVGRRYNQLIHHLRDGIPINNWDELCSKSIPTREGSPIRDCIACMVGPIATGAANAAKYISKADIQAGSEVIFDVWNSQTEGAWRHKNYSYNKWVVHVALPAAFACREVDDELIYG
jgi:hypothetical protein